MISFTATIKQFSEQGEKTGWTYIEIPQDISDRLKPGYRRSFRVKGKLDGFPIEGVALLPMAGGGFIMPVNAVMRRGIKKKKGTMLRVQLSVDTKPLAPPAAFLECLEDEPAAKAFFNEMKLSHRNYFIKWLWGVKTDAALTKRIADVITALNKKQNYVEMIRSQKAEKGY
jgi:hypothetical protein